MTRRLGFLHWPSTATPHLPSDPAALVYDELRAEWPGEYERLVAAERQRIKAWLFADRCEAFDIIHAHIRGLRP